MTTQILDVIAVVLISQLIYLFAAHYKQIDFLFAYNGVKQTSCSSFLKPPNAEFPQPPSRSVLHSYKSAAICSDSEVCSEIGRNILLLNGSAVDAAIATLLCNGLIAMQSMGLGGGMLMNVYLRHEQLSYSILSREVAPLNAHSKLYDNFKNISELTQSALSIAVPAEVMGYAVAHERFGKLPWRVLVQPTLNICKTGYKLTQHQYDALLLNRLMINNDLHLRRMFVDPSTDTFYRVGKHIRPPFDLCRTYELLALNGPRSFYTDNTTNIAADLLDMESIVSEQDLHSLQSKLVPSYTLPLDNYLLHLTPPPGSGQVIAFIMNILKKFKEDFKNVKHMSHLEIHRIAEALKFGFVKRWQLDAEIDEKLNEQLNSPDYAQSLAQLINDTHAYADAEYYGADMALMGRPEHGTAHISVLAPNGDAVSVTSSINFYFGSGRTGKRTGILFNNAMSDFSINKMANYFDLPNIASKNFVRPSISPMSSMAPIIVTNRHDGDVRLIVGAAGGTKIISVLIQILVRTLWLKQNIKEAIDEARFHHQLLPNVLEYEYGILQSVIEALEAKGHQTFRYRERGSAVCGIERVGNVAFANADYRKDGGVAGF